MGLKWAKEFELGHADIDRQHKELFRSFSDILEAAQLGKGKEKIEELLDFLDMYVVFHFDSEEKLMRQLSYPYLDAHVAEHGEFIGQFKAMREEFRCDGATTALLVTINEFLLRWIINHIRKTDMAMAAYLAGTATHQ